ncbi:BN159_2729 family protein [Streptomyces sp. NPDC050738]|uniref:BN159_2729 family protein n=1 Tax=Streptomyces sp. NPDC050738 TaxID=3154744 RepID=UPI00342200B6
MNKNFPNAVRIIREALASSGSDPSAAIAHALDEGRMLVNPERSFGVVLKRNPAGRLTRIGQEPTMLEQQAHAWDISCARAQALADQIRQECPEGNGLIRALRDGSAVTVVVQVTTSEQWAEWCAYLCIEREGVGSPEYAYIGRGHRDGVEVTLTAYDAPVVLAQATAAAEIPYVHHGFVYDLALPQRDNTGRIWDVSGALDDGMPMLSLRGHDIRCALDNIVTQLGAHLAAVTEPDELPKARDLVATIPVADPAGETA